jgi:thiosulfate/3-mercaptopyruvate sulfurtransferase
VSRCVFRSALMVFLFFSLALPSTVLLRAQIATEPWTEAQTVQAAELAKELASGSAAPTVLYVGFQRLYDAGHIQGAQYHGTGSKAEGIAETQKWADPLSRSTNLVIYCGCCPMEKCPNIRPAFLALRKMGFTSLRVLILPNSFAVDWAEKGLPYEKTSNSGQARTDPSKP